MYTLITIFFNWYIVESRRINGKPRPIVLAYLGNAEDLILRLHGLTSGLRIKSYSHGAVAALLKVANTLDVCNIINQHINSPRPYMPRQPIRNNLTAGSTFLLAAIGRVCMPTSKQGWWNWAKTTTCQYLLKCSLNWSTVEIIKAYYGQSQIEHTFKNLKNPYHLALQPQFHWTDQKIMAHYFICVLGYLLTAIVWRQARSKREYSTGD